jgi:hypothetical protein
MQVLFESNRSQSLVWLNNANIVCKAFGPGPLVARHFTAFLVFRPLYLNKVMTILSATKLLSLDDLIEFRLMRSPVMLVTLPHNFF